MKSSLDRGLTYYIRIGISQTFFAARTGPQPANDFGDGATPSGCHCSATFLLMNGRIVNYQQTKQLLGYEGHPATRCCDNHLDPPAAWLV